MNDDGSLFSFLKPSVEASPPVPRSYGALDEAAGDRNLSALETRLARLEAAPASASADRVAALENRLEALSKELQDLRAGLDAAAARAQLAAEALKAELRSQVSRAAADFEASLAKREAATPVNVAFLETRIKHLEDGIAEELDKRFSILDAAQGDARRKALTAHEAAFGAIRRLDKLEESTSRLAYLEKRVDGEGVKIDRIYACEASLEAMKAVQQEAQSTMQELLRRFAVVSAGHDKGLSDMESFSRQLAHLSALLNHFRTELGFLMPGRKESAGG